MSVEYEDKDYYVLLDFQGKDLTKLLQEPNIYFKMLNLNEPKPIVEIGEDIYEGTYDEAVGTNVYFEESEDPPINKNAFEMETPITLKYLLKQTKILKMERLGIKTKPITNMNPMELVNVNITDDYRALLDKYENNMLNVEDYINNGVEEESGDKVSSSETDNEIDEESRKWKYTELPATQSSVSEWYSANEGQVKKEPTDATYLKYLQLQKLAQQPTSHKRCLESSTDYISELSLCKRSKDKFFKWKQLVMEKVEQQNINLDGTRNNIEDFVDIDGSIRKGIINHSNGGFTDEEKEKLLSFNNFINVSPIVKLVMLEEYVKLERAALEQLTSEQKVEDDEGCTNQEKLKLLEDFRDELKNYIMLRFQDESDDTEQLQKDVNMVLSDDEDTDYMYLSDEDEQNSASDEEACDNNAIHDTATINKMDTENKDNC